MSREWSDREAHQWNRTDVGEDVTLPAELAEILSDKLSTDATHEFVQHLASIMLPLNAHAQREKDTPILSFAGSYYLDSEELFLA